MSRARRLTLIVFTAALMQANSVALRAAEKQLSFHDPSPQRYELSARASQIDPRTQPHPEINFVFEKNGKPAVVENASVDTRVKPRGELVIWMMGYSEPLFERVNSYGLHAIRVHYANGWFSRFGKEPPPADDKFLGRIRLEAATGEDFSDVVDIPQPDGMMERALQLVTWLAKENPPGGWDNFLTDDRQGLRWDRVIMAGASHGSTTSARFAKHQRVARVVMFCGPRDQYETWQALPSATPASRYFAFSHVLDGGWTGHHYDRSWELLGLNQFGPIVNIDKASPPYGNTRRLITAADVKNDARGAHSSVVPGRASPIDAEGNFLMNRLPDENEGLHNVGPDNQRQGAWARLLAAGGKMELKLDARFAASFRGGTAAVCYLDRAEDAGGTFRIVAGQSQTNVPQKGSGRWETAEWVLPGGPLAARPSGAHLAIVAGEKPVCLHMVEVSRR